MAGVYGLRAAVPGTDVTFVGGGAHLYRLGASDADDELTHGQKPEDKQEGEQAGIHGKVRAGNQP